MRSELHHGDCLDVLRSLPDCSVDAVVTDPPYGLSFMGKRWDYDVPAVEVWAECLRVLKPGGHLLAFAGTRTQHRMAVRIEDAGFEIRDMIAWVYGSGFPKSLDVSKAIDKRGGASVAWFGPWFRKWREDNSITQKQVAALFPSKSGGLTGCVANWELGFNMPTPDQFNLIRDTFDLPFDSVEEAEREVVGQQRGTMLAVAPGQDNDRSATALDITAPATAAARQWQGWGTALKPSLEPVTVARKPLMSPSINVLKTVESQLRERGVRGEILWKPEGASGAAKKKPRAILSSTEVRQVEETFAATAGVKETQRDGLKTETSFAPNMPNGAMQTEIMSVSTISENETGYGTKCSPLTAENAPAAEKLSAISSPSTTSMEEDPSIGSQSMGRSTTSSSEKDSQLDTECFAGIATGLTGSTAHVHIKRDSSGFYLWPKGLPEFVPGTPLTVAENVLAHGTGALNIDASRIDAEEGRPLIVSNRRNGNGVYRDGLQGSKAIVGGTNTGRWPANLIHDGSEEVSRLMTGGEARFFYTAKASKDDRDEGLEGFALGSNMRVNGPRENEEAKHATLRANVHPTVKPTDLMRYLCRLVTPLGGTVLDPFMGSGSTGKAAILEGFSFIGIERESEYIEIARARIDAVTNQPKQQALF